MSSLLPFGLTESACMHAESQRQAAAWMRYTAAHDSAVGHPVGEQGCPAMLSAQRGAMQTPCQQVCSMLTCVCVCALSGVFLPPIGHCLDLSCVCVCVCCVFAAAAFSRACVCVLAAACPTPPAAPVIHARWLYCHNHFFSAFCQTPCYNYLLWLLQLRTVTPPSAHERRNTA